MSWVVPPHYKIGCSRGALDAPVAGGGPHGDSLVLEDGASYLLLEDGSSSILKE